MTLDQARSVMAMVDTISQKSSTTTTSLTAGRGRGKSATLGLVIASSIIYGYSNIFITAPSPENLNTLFEFIIKGLKALNYKEHTDFEIFQSTNPDFKECVVKISIYRDHRQTIQYVQPQDFNKMLQPEILVIDEAAAIPLPIVKHMMGQYLVFMSSTINGYEGTGRSLSLKLISQLRDQNKLHLGDHTTKSGTKSIRDLKEIVMDEPIRYGINDPIEEWLNNLLCLNCTVADPLESGATHPELCDLYFVNRDTLFSYHKGSEKFLKKLMSLFVSSHYKNSPNDLQLLSDAPGHALFVLIGPLDRQKSKIPDILCAIQVCYEGNVSKEAINNNMARGMRPSGDLIPWTVSEQFQDDNFGMLNGVRVVRIATHPNAQKKGYGTKALELLQKYYDGLMIDIDNIKTDEIDELYVKEETPKEEGAAEGLLEENIKQRKGLPPILQKLNERKPLNVQYLGTSFGITQELYGFWTKNSYVPLYIRQTANDLTGEHTCILIKPLKKDEISIGVPAIAYEENKDDNDGWAEPYTGDFRKRFINLLGFEFRKMSCTLALNILLPSLKSHVQAEELNVDYTKLEKDYIKREISTFDLKRLESYAKNLIDFHLIIDLVPRLAKLYFTHHFDSVLRMSYVQASIFLGIGLQHKKIEELSVDLGGLKPNQILPQLNKTVKKFTNVFRAIYEEDAQKEIPEFVNPSR
jgi:N-acetyltransferase 10